MMTCWSAGWLDNIGFPSGPGLTRMQNRKGGLPGFENLPLKLFTNSLAFSSVIKILLVSGCWSYLYCLALAPATSGRVVGASTMMTLLGVSSRLAQPPPAMAITSNTMAVLAFAVIGLGSI